MHADDRFSGHLDNLDPRTPIFASGACDWPTIPAYRYMLVSDDAIGIMDFLNTDGILIEHMWTGGGIHLTQWSGPLNLVPVTVALFVKEWEDSNDHSDWRFLISFLGFGPIGGSFVRPQGPCNVPMTLGNYQIPTCPSCGETGATFRMLQVEHDQVLPPDWP